MNILVTGGNGFIGHNLVKRLLVEGHFVASLDDLSSGMKENELSGASYIYKDIENIHELGGDFDVVFHLAAHSRIQPTFLNPTEAFRVNVGGTEAVCEWARNNNVRVIYAGSSSRWHDPTQSPYAMYKYLGEEVCKMYKSIFEVRAEITRFYNVYGPGEILDGDWAAVIGIWRRQVRDGEKISIVGDGLQRRDFTHVEDIIDGLYRIAVSDEEHEDAWELGTGKNYSINEVYKMFQDHFGVESVNLPSRPGEYPVTLRQHSDALDRLGWKPSDRLNEYIQGL
ncbi:TPA: hypothetical protein DEB00_00475 [Candidatus Uhrbacteria bacterium]|nr:hypothetical protein [Candidatus Uhrbacteria bacterium]